MSPDNTRTVCGTAESAQVNVVSFPRWLVKNSYALSTLLSIPYPSDKPGTTASRNPHENVNASANRNPEPIEDRVGQGK